MSGKPQSPLFGDQRSAKRHEALAKHGFYTKNFSRAERRGLQATRGVVLGDEIALLRVLIRRFAEQVQVSQGLALMESGQHLAVVGEAMLRLATPLRIDHMLGGAESNTFKLKRAQSTSAKCRTQGCAAQTA